MAIPEGYTWGSWLNGESGKLSYYSNKWDQIKDDLWLIQNATQKNTIKNVLTTKLTEVQTELTKIINEIPNL